MSRDGLESLQIEKLFLQKGIGYLSVMEGWLTSESVDDEFMSYIRAGLNQRERKLTAVRTRHALQLKKERGERIGGRPRYGWRVINGVLVPDPTEQETLGRMRSLQAKGHTTRQIVEALKRDGVKTRKGTWFTQTQVCRVLKAA
jgi:site-specific DNA recombinase